jgi:two-component system sensor histidine kinase/response regulator
MDSTRILIVDDDASVTRILKRVFERAGLDVTTVRDGTQALTALAGGTFRIMVCDIQMPRMTGRELCRHLVESGPYLPERIFIVTSRTEAEERGWVEEFPNISLVEKPVGPKQLLKRVSDWIVAGRAEVDDPIERRAA